MKNIRMLGYIYLFFPTIWENSLSLPLSMDICLPACLSVYLSRIQDQPNSVHVFPLLRFECK